MIRGAKRPPTGPCIGCGGEATWNKRVHGYRCFACGMARSAESQMSLHARSGPAYERWKAGTDELVRQRAARSGPAYDEWERRRLVGIKRYLAEHDEP